MFRDFVMDVSNGEPYCFCPYEADGTVVFGLNIIAARCPGNLVGIIHSGGNAAAEAWLEANPDWRERYRMQTERTGE